MTVKNEEKIKKALIKKAMGYDAKEVLEEYNIDENGEQHLAKRKVSKKHYAPDITAIKLLIAYFSEQTIDELDKLSDDELMKERNRLLNLLEVGITFDEN